MAASLEGYVTINDWVGKNQLSSFPYLVIYPLTGWLEQLKSVEQVMTIGLSCTEYYIYI